VAAVGASVSNLGAWLVKATSIEKDCSAMSVPSLTTSFTSFKPVLEFVGVPLSVAVPSPLSTKVIPPGSVPKSAIVGVG
jgi:hypothetical protein